MRPTDWSLSIWTQRECRSTLTQGRTRGPLSSQCTISMKVGDVIVYQYRASCASFGKLFMSTYDMAMITFKRCLSIRSKEANILTSVIPRRTIIRRKRDVRNPLRADTNKLNKLNNQTNYRSWISEAHIWSPRFQQTIKCIVGRCTLSTNAKSFTKQLWIQLWLSIKFLQ